MILERIPGASFKKKEMWGRNWVTHNLPETKVWLQELIVYYYTTPCMLHIKSAHFWGICLVRQQITANHVWLNFFTHRVLVRLPGHVDPPWWGSAGAGEQQGEACVVVCWYGCSVWTHLKEPVGDVGRKADDGSSHPGSEKCAVQAGLVSPTGVSLVGCNITQKKKENRHR